MDSLKEIALQRAATHAHRPEIYEPLNRAFQGWSHFMVRSYHKRITRCRPNGKKITTRWVKGYIFIYLAHKNGKTSRKPICHIYIEKMTRKEFATYARTLAENSFAIKKVFTA
jgi:hypothetical protein